MEKTVQEEILRRLSNSRVSRDRAGIKTLWFDEPFYLYIEDEQAENYLEMISIEQFAEQLHGPAKDLIDINSERLLSGLEEPIDFYDLGPGLPTKTVPLLLELRRQCRGFTYRPVDVNHRFLQLTEKEISRIGVVAKSLNCLFEELPSKIEEIGSDAKSKVFMIGLTFNNYRPAKILRLLQRMSGPGDVSIITTEFYSTKRKARILSPYEEKITERFNRYLLTIIGLPAEKLSYFTDYRNQRIEMGFTIKEEIHVGSYKFESGTRIVTAISYRYTRKTLIKHIQKYFKSFDIFEDKAHHVSLVAFRLWRK